jgi:hypothetical protein
MFFSWIEPAAKCVRAGDSQYHPAQTAPALMIDLLIESAFAD